MKFRSTKTYLIAAVVVGFFVLGYTVALTTNKPAYSKNNPHHCEKDDERPICESVWERTSDDPTAFFTFWLVIFTAALAAGSLIQMRFLTRADQTARTAANAAKASSDIAIISQRPWISLQCFISDPVVLSDDCVEVMVNFRLKNTGGTPALNVWVKSDIGVAVWVGDDPRKRLMGVAAQALSVADGRLGATVLFPGEEHSVRQALFLSQADIDAANRNFGYDLGLKTFMQQFGATILGVVDYRFSFSQERHQTGAIYDLTEINDFAEAATNLPGSRTIEIPVSRLRLAQNWAGFAD